MTEANRHRRSDPDARVDLDESVDHHLPLWDADAWMHDDGAADTELARHDREPVHQARQDSNAERVEPRLRSIAGLGEKRFAHPHEPQHLTKCVKSSTEAISFAAGYREHLGVGDDGLDETWGLRPRSSHHHVPVLAISPSGHRCSAVALENDRRQASRATNETSCWSGRRGPWGDARQRATKTIPLAGRRISVGCVPGALFAILGLANTGGHSAVGEQPSARS